MRVTTRVVDAAGRPLKRKLRGGEVLTVVSCVFEQSGGGVHIPPEDTLVLIVTPRRREVSS